MEQLKTFEVGKIKDFKNSIQALSAHGGGDCPELAFHGIVDAMEKGNPKPESPMYVFTDATAKDASHPDPYNADNAVSLALDTWTSVHMFYGKSKCPKPQYDKNFQRLASETNGQELLFSSGAEIKKVIFLFFIFCQRKLNQ